MCEYLHNKLENACMSYYSVNQHYVTKVMPV